MDAPTVPYEFPIVELKFISGSWVTVRPDEYRTELSIYLLQLVGLRCLP